jgi:hypothetical protein
MNQTILKYLKECPEFRLRRNKNKYIGAICLKKYGIELTPKLKDQLADLVTDIDNAGRYWRLHTSENPELQGSDYLKDKDLLEQQKQVELGYVPNHHTDLKKLAAL